MCPYLPQMMTGLVEPEVEEVPEGEDEGSRSSGQCVTGRRTLRAYPDLPEPLGGCPEPHCVPTRLDWPGSGKRRGSF
jgi:hypothetical protein